jgi:hypothetical protein
VIRSGAEGFCAPLRNVTKAWIPANNDFEVWYMSLPDERPADLSPRRRPR